jgi:hypothetical protein
VLMDASSHRRRLAFCLDVVAAVSDDGPGMAIGYHVGPKVAAIDMANCDTAAVAIDAPVFAGDVAFAKSARASVRLLLVRRPSVGAPPSRTLARQYPLSVLLRT